MTLTSDILYILLDYCDPIDTNIASVIEVLTGSENSFDNFVKYSVQKTQRERMGKEYYANIVKKDRKNQFKQFQKMKEKNKYKLLELYNYTIQYNNEYKLIKLESGETIHADFSSGN